MQDLKIIQNTPKSLFILRFFVILRKHNKLIGEKLLNIGAILSQD